MTRVRIAAPVVATAVASPVYQLLLLSATTLLSTALLSQAALSSVLPSTIYDTVVAAIVGPLVLTIVVRRRAQERMDW